MSRTPSPTTAIASETTATATANAAPAGPGLLLTASEHAAHTQELKQLRTLRDRDLPQRLREARTFVTADAVEEIAQIQTEQTVMDARIAALETLLATSTVIDDGDAVDVVTLGCTVDVVYLRNGRRATYRVTGTGTQGGSAAVSARSPVGQALLGRRAGETVEAILPGDRTEQLEITTVTRTADALS